VAAREATRGGAAEGLLWHRRLCDRNVGDVRVVGGLGVGVAAGLQSSMASARRVPSPSIHPPCGVGGSAQGRSVLRRFESHMGPLETVYGGQQTYAVMSTLAAATTVTT
jgi:hypothetical protein